MSFTSSAAGVSSMLLGALFLACLIGASEGGNFYRDVDITWGDGRGKILRGGGGKLLSLSIDKYSGSGFESKNEYLFGRFDMQIKLVPGNSAGLVTTFYLKSRGPLRGPKHDEIDFEFLGNSTGQPYTLHTNVYAQGIGVAEQQFRLWFDPTKAFHTYSVIWNIKNIIFLVDNTPIRVFRNLKGIPYPTSQPMKVYASLWNSDDWATQGGKVKADWTNAPYTAYYSNFNTNACIWKPGKPCTLTSKDKKWGMQTLDNLGRRSIRRVQQKYMIYNYCKDPMRFKLGLPRECLRNSKF
ncbi:hypothetical protein Tsubulata_012223 [Turnera subulata]|uniref:Xyloglucan endotransglucosylase/hydrolase n=1 Tax=Turnera subulata TaxID=218843 RepID=A0A9Q0J7D5_9ROSI|nr:hypothetical protein Tsubulata_012223 [Turnera subulata]